MSACCAVFLPRTDLQTTVWSSAIVWRLASTYITKKTTASKKGCRTKPMRRRVIDKLTHSEERSSEINRNMWEERHRMAMRGERHHVLKKRGSIFTTAAGFLWLFDFALQNQAEGQSVQVPWRWVQKCTSRGSQTLSRGRTWLRSPHQTCDGYILLLCFISLVKYFK